MSTPDVCAIVEYQGSKWRVTGWIKDKPNSKRQQWCTRDEATHLCLYAVCGAIAPVGECKEVGFVSWSAEAIEDQRQQALALAGETII